MNTALLMFPQQLQNEDFPWEPLPTGCNVGDMYVV